MRRVSGIIAVVLFILVTPLMDDCSPVNLATQEIPYIIDNGHTLLAQAGGVGEDTSATLFMSRNITNQQITILNSYASDSTHELDVSYSNYHIPGWTLYKLTVHVDNLTAAPERETFDIVPNYSNTIENNSGFVTDALFQEFYQDQPFDGKLENYSIVYNTNYYDAGTHGHAYLVVRSDYSDGQTNETGWITPFSQGILDRAATHDCSADNAILNASTYYYAVIDGTAMEGVYAGGWYFNRINWRSRRPLSGLQTGYNLRDSGWYNYTGVDSRVALLNYTYTPWNKTSNANLLYPHPENASLTGNSTALSTNAWTFKIDTNISQVTFESNQSLYINHNLTLWYERSVVSTTEWNVVSSGSLVDWNVSTFLSYRKLPSATAKFLNVTVPVDWTATGLYNSTNPSSNYNNFTQYSSIIYCVNMTNGTWTLTFTAYNYLTQLETYISGTPTSLDDNASILVDVDINSTIQDESSNPATNGPTNLTIIHSGSTVYAPSETDVTQGHSHYLWDISSVSSGSGVYRIEVYWSNGTEAGYQIKELLVYFPTSLTADEYTIDAYTDNTFNIGVQYDNITSGSVGLTSLEARVSYSFDGAQHQDMFDAGNGRWTQSISTLGKGPGDYTVEVNATGLGLENQTLTLDVTLTYETNPLEIQWSPSNTITYVGSTIFSVNYTLIDGTPIENAEVNVTYGIEVWDLKWDPVSEIYNITFNGTDAETGLGIHSLDISAWKADHENQSIQNEILTINKEPTSIVVTWSNGDTITYIESTTLIVEYRMSNGTPIPDALLNVTMGTHYEDLLWDVSETYRHQFTGADDPPGIGIHGLFINASKFGYEEIINSDYTLTIQEEPTNLVFEWTTYSMDWTEDVIFVVNYTDTNSDLITDATQLDIRVNGTLYSLHGDNGTYWIEFNNTFELWYHIVEVNISKFGYEYAFDGTLEFTINEAATTLTDDWTSITTDYLGWMNVTLNYTYDVDGSSVPVDIGNANITIDGGTPLNLNASGNFWIANFSGVYLDLGTHNVVVDLWAKGYVYQTDSYVLNVNNVTTVLSVSWTPSNAVIDYVNSFDLVVDYTYGGGDVPDAEAEVNVTLDGHFYPLAYSAGAWRVTIDGDVIDTGIFQATIMAWRYGYEERTNVTSDVTVTLAATTLQVYWTPTTVDYLGQIDLTVNFTYDGDQSPVPIVGNNMNISIDGQTPIALNTSGSLWTANLTGVYLDLGSHSVVISAWAYGYETKTDGPTTLNVNNVTTILDTTWQPLDVTIDYLSTLNLTADYYYGASQPVPATQQNVNITIDGSITLDLNQSGNYWIANLTGVYLDLGSHNVEIQAWAYGYQYQVNNTVTLIVENVSTLITVTWTPVNATIDYVNSFDIVAEYTYAGIDVPDSAKVNVTINSQVFPMTYVSDSWQVTIDGDVLDVGVYSASIDAWLYGYEWATNITSTVIVEEAPTKMTVEWDFTTIDYIGQIDLTVNYTYNGTGLPVSISGNYINITIDGSSDRTLTQSGDSWTTTLTGSYLDLGVHNVVIRGWEYGYVYQQRLAVLTVNNVTTSLDVTWDPANVTIEFTDYLNLTVDYTYSGGDVSSSAEVNVTINGESYELVFSAGLWRYEIYGPDIGIGYYDASISAWLYGYEHETNITYGVNITLAANLFWVTWNPLDRNVTYIDDISAAVNYTRDFIPVTDATVNLYLNGSGPYPLTYNPVDERFHITLSGSVIDLGVWNATITANRTGYESQSAQSYLTVNQDVPIVVPSWTVDITDYVSPKDLTVSVTDSQGTDIDDAIFSVQVAGTSPDAVFITDGEYNITLGPLLTLGIQEVNVTVTRWGYRTTTLLLSLNVTATETQGIFDRTSTTIFYDESVDLQISFQMLNTSFVPTGTCTVNVEGISHSITWNVNHWETEFLGNELGLGVHHCTIETSAYGYVTQNDQFDITVNPIPTLVQLSANRSLFVNDTLQLFVTYSDTRTDTPIDLEIQTITWTGSYEWSEVTTGNYSLVLNSSGIHVGDYALEVLLEKTGYENETMQWDIQVKPVLVVVLISAPQVTWENETITVSVRLNDTVHGAWIHWANATLTLDGMNFSMEYVPASHLYTKTLWLNDTISPDSYTISVLATALDCEQMQNNHTILVNQKITYSLTLTMPINVTIGTPLVVQINVTEGTISTGIAIPVRVYAEYFVNESIVDSEYKEVTTRDGNAEVSFNVDELFDHIIVWAEFEGSIQEWPEESDLHSVGVNAETVLTPLEALMAFFSDTTVQMAIVGIILLGIVGASYTKVIKPRRQAEEKVLERQLSTFIDLNAVRHFMGVYTDRGTCVYYHPFTESRIQPDLISGFITAITSVYGEITGEDGVVGTLEEIHYHGLRLNSFSGKFIIGILIIEGDMTDLMRDRLQFFVEMFENEYEEHLDDWVGVMDCFNPEWVVSNLNAAFNYHWRLPHRLGNIERGRKDFKNITKLIEGSLDERKEFLFEDILEPIADRFDITKAEALELLLLLADLDIIHPISVHTVLQRSGLGLSGEDEEVVEEPYLDEEEPIELKEEVVEPKEEEPKKKKRKKKKKVEEEPEVEPPPEEEPLVKEEDEFLAEVEKLLSEEKKEKPETTEEKEPDELDQFVADVEKILSDEDNDKSDTSK